ncbi:hypothetical protein AC578_8170 [Pseudocercospora eumusae]|uniref:Uncharacterized protein n=1 Tax=Pseudocercospora eumusae TaxID=321146 RepID=A0A139HAL8_9PEZI|nr:hypothetical protein AC578_8170 [Pseudocercospora eumusae]
MSAIATLETEAIVNYLHADIITKNRSQIEYARESLARMRPPSIFTRLISRQQKPLERRRAELEGMLRDAEAQLRQAKVVQNQVHMVSGMIVVGLMGKEKFLKGEEEEEEDEMILRIDSMLETLTCSNLVKEIEGARGALGLRSLGEVAEDRARDADLGEVKRALFKVERKWEAMKALAEWQGIAAP